MDRWVDECMGREVEGYLIDPVSRVPVLGPLMAWNTALYIITNHWKEMTSSQWNLCWHKTQRTLISN